MQRLVDAALGYMEELRQSGHFIVSNALQRGRTARTIRVRDGKVTTTDGPFAETKEQLGGFFLIEAKDHRRGVRGGREVPAGPDRDHRGASGAGAAALLAAAPTRHERAHGRRPRREAVETVYRSDSRRVLATLIRLLGDFDLAEEAPHEAFAAAVEQWPRERTPTNRGPGSSPTGRHAADSGAPPREVGPAVQPPGRGRQPRGGAGHDH